LTKKKQRRVTGDQIELMAARKGHSQRKAIVLLRSCSCYGRLKRLAIDRAQAAPSPVPTERGTSRAPWVAHPQPDDQERSKVASP